MANHLFPLSSNNIFFYLLTITIVVSFGRAERANYIVHMDLAAMPQSFSDHHTWYQHTLESVLPAPTASSSKLLYSYTHAIQGFSASLTPSEIEALRSAPGYLHSVKESRVVLDTTHTARFLGLSPDFGAWPASSHGKDIIIGVIDTGVWPESLSYSDVGFAPVPSKWRGTCETGTNFTSSMCNRKLIGAQSFNKGLLAKKPKTRIRMNSPRDTDGHGTHTSSTAAGFPVSNASYFGYASGTATGMASLARVAMYKVFWDEEESEADIVAAVDKAIADGVDVLSMSLGLDVARLLDDSIATATFSAIQKGIFVSLSAGNYLPALHNGSPWALTVAAGTVDQKLGGMVVLGNGVRVKGESFYLNRTTPNKAPVVLLSNCDDGNALKTVPKDTVVVCSASDEVTLQEQVAALSITNPLGVIFITRDADTSSYLDNSYPSIFLDWEAGKIVGDYHY